MEVCVRSVAVSSNLYWKMSLAGWGIFRWPRVGYFGWPSGEGKAIEESKRSNQVAQSPKHSLKEYGGNALW